MDKNEYDIIEYYKETFENSANILSSLEENIKNYVNGYWGTSILLERTPFENERSQYKMGKRLTKEPKNKANKFFHREDDNKALPGI